MRLLLVGLGVSGRLWMRLAFPALPEVELAGCVDVDPGALAAAREQFGVPRERCFTSLPAALSATSPDVVLVSTPLEDHVASTAASLRAGAHVLLEKPFAPTLAEARGLVDLAEECGQVLMVSQNYRFFPAVRAVVELVRRGELGALHEVEVDFRHHSTAGADGRRGHRALDQPLLMDMSIHHFDLLRLLLGRDATWISCHAWNPPWSDFDGPPCALATLRMGDVMVGYRGSWITGGGDTPWAGEWRLTFERGEAWWTSRGLGADDDGERVVVRRPDGVEEQLRLPDLALVDRAGSLVELLNALRAGREPESSGRENLGSLAIALAAVESSERGGEPIPI